ncbi:hypothetical protein [Streptomyces sp. NPDC048496]
MLQVEASSTTGRLPGEFLIHDLISSVLSSLSDNPGAPGRPG